MSNLVIVLKGNLMKSIFTKRDAFLLLASLIITLLFILLLLLTRTSNKIEVEEEEDIIKTKTAPWRIAQQRKEKAIVFRPSTETLQLLADAIVLQEQPDWWDCENPTNCSEAVWIETNARGKKNNREVMAEVIWKYSQLYRPKATSIKMIAAIWRSGHGGWYRPEAQAYGKRCHTLVKYWQGEPIRLSSLER